MNFDTRQGEKGSQDFVLRIATNGYEELTFEDLFWMVKLLYDNEDKIYFHPNCKGSRLLLEALEHLRTHTVKETLLKFGLKGRITQ